MTLALLDKIRQAGGTVSRQPTVAEPVVLKGEIIGDELRLLVPTELADKIEAGRPRLEQVLDEIVGDQHGNQDLDQDAGSDPLEQAIVPPPPCPICGSLELWRTVGGTWLCQHCNGDALRRSRDLASRARRLREQARLLPVGGKRPRAGEPGGEYECKALCRNELGGGGVNPYSLSRETGRPLRT